MDKPLCLGLSILRLSKILMCDFCYDYVKPKTVWIKLLSLLHMN